MCGAYEILHSTTNSSQSSTFRASSHTFCTLGDFMPAAFELDNEAAWELRASAMGVERYRRAAKAADPSVLPAAQRLFQQTVRPLIAAMEANKAHVSSAKGRKKVRNDALIWLAGGDSQQQACSAVSIITGQVVAPSWDRESHYLEGMPVVPILKLALSVASILIVTRENEEWIEAEGKAEGKASPLLKKFKARYPEPTADDWRAFRKSEGLEPLELDKELQVAIGSAVIQWLVEGSPEAFVTRTVISSGRSLNILTITPETSETLQDIAVRAEIACPMLSPMIIPPNDWRYGDNGRLEGGYCVLRVEGLRVAQKSHTGGVKRPISDASLAALNAIQRTPWTVNTWLQGVAEACHLMGIIVGDRSVKVDVPGRMEATQWEALGKDGQRAYSQRRRKAFEHNATAKGQEDALLNTLAGARQISDRESLFFPHSLDFRGRIYPVPSWGPNPQGSDLAKGLLQFARGSALGPDGLYWLYIRAANTAGQDKLPLTERLQWVQDNLESIEHCAATPLEFDWWRGMSEPWSFLATCREIEAAGQDPEFVSHLPIPLDGSCNGLQHLSAMALDPIGATATNLRAGLPRQDIYGEVAKECSDLVDRDIRDDNEEALAWQGKVTRAVVKRAVMTTPYGVTKGGIRTQLINDGHAPGDDGAQRGRAADYLKNTLIKALDAKAGAARGIMAWLQATAFRLAQAEIPFEWTTPSGNRIRQSYRIQTSTRVNTLAGKLVLMGEDSSSGLDPKKQSLGSAPNYVHSFDAAHLTNTVLAAVEEGVSDFAMIHDSFGTHACNTTRLARVLRDTFVAIYREDWLLKLHAELTEAHPHVDLPPPPGRGEFDLEEVLESEFFFS